MVRHAQAVQCSAKKTKTKHQYPQKDLSYFAYLLHVVTHPWKLQGYHAVLVRYGPACPKFSKTTNHQYLWKGVKGLILLIFACSYLQVVRYPLKLQKHVILDWHCQGKSAWKSRSDWQIKGKSARKSCSDWQIKGKSAQKSRLDWQIL